MRSRLAPARLLARSSRRLSTATAIAPLDFTDPRTAFSGTSTAELLRGAVVLTACTIRPFVMNAEMLLGLSTKVFGKTFTDTVVRKTFFAHFVAGESAEGIKPVMQALKAQGVGGILDYAAEADMGDNPLTAGNANQPARVYPYAGEDECDANMQHFLTGVKAVADTSPDGFAAIKVTALGDPKLLERISDSLSAIQGDLPRAAFGFFTSLDKDGNGGLSKEEFTAGWLEAFDGVTAEQAGKYFDKYDTNKSGEIDPIEWSLMIPIEEVPKMVSKCKKAGPVKSTALSPDELVAMKNMLSRCDNICAYAAELGVRLMIDAEHFHMQPAIDQAVLTMQLKYNKTYPAVYNTYQAYLRRTPGKLREDLERCKREDIHFGGKLASHASYAECMTEMLVRSPVPEKTSPFFASHNEDSVRMAVGLLSSGESKVTSDKVGFGQLLGMSDHLTFTLGGAGLKAYKYVPYGPLDEVMPYLLRRAQENSDALGGARDAAIPLPAAAPRSTLMRGPDLSAGAPLQRAMMLAEVKRRMFG
ncbi:proline dehydrogenase [Emiliania huxleyi CCMP1516]|uniref:Proline dehydrogenase n=2 Tax=Emiliania huxleyi TaxID=2903 RepID=A0A0D3KSF1_EMIH1|nr:proline dehydrogenase [Emiliania huxleyi CCMP1516]EOD38686.1 proline dehydrogenase [Emiliania huxleyi CCMP1516]|eukprot:XP_005791115.1 proline dehydrogenase [Emiliania huxleyi CCMP1516]